MRRLAWLCLAVVVAACGASSSPVITPTATSASATASIAADGGAPIDDAPLADAATWEKWKRADYVVLAPHRFVATIAPLVRHREAGGHVVAVLEVEPLFARFSKGKPDARALKEAVTRLAAHADGKLKFVLLAGDVNHPNDASADDVPVPAFYAKKMDYEHHTPEEHRPNGVTQSEHAKYPTDHPLELAGAKGAKLAVGRIPARTDVELATVIQKIIDYETSEPDGEWRRRVSIFTGPANYGEVADTIIESIASHMLDEELSYDYDVHFAFAKPDSPYAYRLDKLRERFIAELDSGALVAAYVGHGADSSFDHVYARGRYWEIGTADDAAALRIVAGRPVFFSFACDTGAFDRPAGRASIAEQMILNPKGPVAVFASSRESHPYANALYAAGVVRKFLDEHAPTLGEGILAVKEAMTTRSIGGAELMVDVDVDALKREHEGLYNLLGDPAMRVRYPDAATVTLDAPTAKPGDRLAVTVTAPTIATGGAIITIETPRSVIRGTLVSPSALDAMSRADAFAAMDENRKKAADKIVTRTTRPFANGRATATLTVPAEPGPYVVKVIVAGAAASGGIAVGNASLRVAR
jgi:hypothetical protein